jgi:hypothetical protein
VALGLEEEKQAAALKTTTKLAAATTAGPTAVVDSASPFSFVRSRELMS